MPGPELLEVVIGLTVVYFLLSLIASGFQEVLAGILGWRAYNLEMALRDLLSPADGQKGARQGDRGLKSVLSWFHSWLGQVVRDFLGERIHIQRQGLQDQFYRHSLIRGLSRPGKSPSYIPSRTFALALVDTLIQSGRSDGNLAAENNLTDPDIVWQMGNPGDLQDYARCTFLELEAGIANIENGQIKQALQAIVRDAKAEADRWDKALAFTRTSLETWFDDSMDRLSGWYKRNAQLFTLSIGIGLAFLFNADTVSMATTLWHEPVLRSAIVSQAEVIVANNRSEANERSIDILETRKKLEGLGLPLGLSTVRFPPADTPPEKLAGAWLSRIFGWLITGIALSLGANFWFDMLNKIINVRTSGEKPKRGAEKSG